MAKMSQISSYNRNIAFKAVKPEKQASRRCKTKAKYDYFLKFQWASQDSNLGFTPCKGVVLNRAGPLAHKLRCLI